MSGQVDAVCVPVSGYEDELEELHGLGWGKKGGGVNVRNDLGWFWVKEGAYRSYDGDPLETFLDDYDYGIV